MSKKELIFQSGLFKLYPERETVKKSSIAAQNLLQGATLIAALGIVAEAGGSKRIGVLLFTTVLVLCIAWFLHILAYWAACRDFCHVAEIYQKSPEELCKMSVAELQRDAMNLLTVRAEHFLKLREQVIEKIDPFTTMEDLVKAAEHCVEARESWLEHAFTVLQRMSVVNVTLDELYEMTEIRLRNTA